MYIVQIFKAKLSILEAIQKVIYDTRIYMFIYIDQCERLRRKEVEDYILHPKSTSTYHINLLLHTIL